VAFRSMFRNKGFTAINIFGLAIGMACSLLIFWSKISRGWPGPYLGQ
jgi:putative ABC transport system permease protein